MIERAQQGASSRNKMDQVAQQRRQRQLDLCMRQLKERRAGYMKDCRNKLQQQGRAQAHAEQGGENLVESPAGPAELRSTMHQGQSERKSLIGSPIVSPGASGSVFEALAKQLLQETRDSPSHQMMPLAHTSTAASSSSSSSSSTERGGGVALLPSTPQAGAQCMEDDSGGIGRPHYAADRLGCTAAAGGSPSTAGGSSSRSTSSYCRQQWGSGGSGSSSSSSCKAAGTFADCDRNFAGSIGMDEDEDSLLHDIEAALRREWEEWEAQRLQEEAEEEALQALRGYEESLFVAQVEAEEAARREAEEEDERAMYAFAEAFDSGCHVGRGQSSGSEMRCGGGESGAENGDEMAVKTAPSSSVAPSLTAVLCPCCQAHYMAVVRKTSVRSPNHSSGEGGAVAMDREVADYDKCAPDAKMLFCFNCSASLSLPAVTSQLEDNAMQDEDCTDIHRDVAVELVLQELQGLYERHSVFCRSARVLPASGGSSSSAASSTTRKGAALSAALLVCQPCGQCCIVAQCQQCEFYEVLH